MSSGLVISDLVFVSLELYLLRHFNLFSALGAWRAKGIRTTGAGFGGHPMAHPWGDDLLYDVSSCSFRQLLLSQESLVALNCPSAMVLLQPSAFFHF